jgi:hypothetical protein
MMEFPLHGVRGADIRPLAKEALFSATMLFERIVWLARLIVMLLSSEPVSPK